WPVAKRMRRMRAAVVAGTLSALSPAAVSAHPAGASTAAFASLDGLVLVSLLGTGLLYARGVRRIWIRAGQGAGVAFWRVVAFAAGLVVMGVALLPPLEGWAETLFSAHMAQHVLLM